MKDKPIVIKKIKKGGHGGHHGGAWKVAYADFVTAMMAFFLLLWLLSSASKDRLKGISDYFAPTVGLRDQKGIGFAGGTNASYKDGVNSVSKGNNGIIYGSPTQGEFASPAQSTSLLDMQDNDNFTNILKEFKETLDKDPDLKNLAENLVVDMSPEGLRLQIVDSNERPMFKPSTYELQPYTQKLLNIIGKIIKSSPNYVVIAGHTKRSGGEIQDINNTSKWVLSSMRANAVKDFLVKYTIKEEQIYRISGNADTEPLIQDDPSNIKNIRMSIILLKSSLVSKNNQSLPVQLLK